MIQNIYNLNSQINEICSQLSIAEKILSYKWFAEKGIEVVFKGEFYLLTKIKTAKLNHWNVLCKALLVNSKFNPVSVPWFHFYPLNETNIDFADCQVIESIEGHEIHVSFNSMDLIVHSETEIIHDPALLELTKKIKFNINDTNHTWTFKVVSKNNSLYLMSGRYLGNYSEFDERDLDLTAHRLRGEVNVFRPEAIFVTKGLQKAYDEIHKQNKSYRYQRRWIVRDCETGERAEIDIESNDKVTWKDLITFWKTMQRTNHLVNMYPRSKDKISVLNNKIEKKINTIFCMADSIRQGWTTIDDVSDVSFPDIKELVESLQTAHKEKWSMIIESSLRKLNHNEIMATLELKDC